MTSTQTTALVQVILRSIINVACITIFALALYCHIEFNEAFKITYAASLCPLIYNSVLIYGFWALFTGRVNDPDAVVASINFTRMVIGDYFIVVIAAASAGYIAAMDLYRFRPGNDPSDAPYKADPWRMIAFGLQIGAGALQLCVAVWNCAGCLRARKAYRHVGGHA